MTAKSDTGQPVISAAEMERLGWLALGETAHELTFVEPPALESPDAYFDRVEAEAAKPKRK